MSFLRDSGIGLFFESIFHHNKSRFICWNHRFSSCGSEDCIYRLPFCYTDIEEVLFKRKLSILYLKSTNIVSFCCILIQYPNIIHSKKCNHKDSKNIGLSKGKTKVLSCCFSFREKRYMSFLCYKNICIHRDFIFSFLKNSRIEDFLFLFYLGNSFYYPKFRTSTSRIFSYFFLCWLYGFFTIFHETSWDNCLPCYVVSHIFHIFSKYIFYEPIFERMKCNYCNLSSNCEIFYCRFK